MPGLRWTWALVFGLAVAAVAVYFAARPQHEAAMSTAAPAADAPAATWPAGRLRAADFRLRDQRGEPISLASLRGRPVVLTFIDPLCRDYCPIEAQRLNDVAASFPRLAIVAVSVNVHGNARANLALDARKWQLTPQWRWAIGQHEQLARVWRDYHVEVVDSTKKIAGITVHRILHTEAAYVIDANGNQRALFIWPFRADGVARALRRLLPAPS
jgi:cytochrome oxidase Cu insertion factor (SCO1/SenC/PrrC family)